MKPGDVSLLCRPVLSIQLCSVRKENPEVWKKSHVTTNKSQVKSQVRTYNLNQEIKDLQVRTNNLNLQVKSKKSEVKLQVNLNQVKTWKTQVQFLGEVIPSQKSKVQVKLQNHRGSSGSRVFL